MGKGEGDHDERDVDRLVVSAFSTNTTARTAHALQAERRRATLSATAASSATWHDLVHDLAQRGR
jgi:hypothetical protein